MLKNLTFIIVSLFLLGCEQSKEISGQHDMNLLPEQNMTQHDGGLKGVKVAEGVVEVKSVEKPVVEEAQVATVEQQVATQSFSVASNNKEVVIFVHGLNSGSSTWRDMASKVSRELGVFGGSYVEIGLDISIKEGAKCWDAKWINEYMSCKDMEKIEDQDIFRKTTRASVSQKSQAYSKIFGLDKGQFNINAIQWKRNSESASAAISDDAIKSELFLNQKVFVVNFSNNNQLTYNAQGEQLKAAIENVKNVTGATKYILIGHSMGGLASRAYIQNEETVNIKKFITIDTPHFGGITYGVMGSGFYFGGYNAGVNLASDSKAFRELNSISNIGNKYDNMEVYHLGYSDGYNGIDMFKWGSYYAESDGIVSIGSQMGLDALHPYRVIFSPHVKGLKKYKAVSGYGYANEIVKSRNYGIIDLHFDLTLAHVMILKEKSYINYILHVITGKPMAQVPTTASVTIKNGSRKRISQVYIQDADLRGWGQDLLTGARSISKHRAKSFTTIQCDKKVDIKAKSFGWFSKTWKTYDVYLECGKEYTIEFR